MGFMTLIKLCFQYIILTMLKIGRHIVSADFTRIFPEFITSLIAFSAFCWALLGGGRKPRTWRFHLGILIISFALPLCFYLQLRFDERQHTEESIAKNLGFSLKIVIASLGASTALSWHPCMLFDGSECAIFKVPNDYDYPEGGQAFIPLLRYPASPGVSYRGMILYNPGGPGVSAVTMLPQMRRQVQNLRDAGYDFVAWEPRGVGHSDPKAGCKFVMYQSPSLLLLLTALKIDPHFEGMIPFYTTMLSNCTGSQETAGSHMSTGTVVRDMISILDAFASSQAAIGLPGASLLNFFGESYGSFIGQTFASLYPERIGNVVLDGVMDPDDHVSDGVRTQGLDADDAFLTFFVYCHQAGADQCAYYTGKSAYAIWLRFKALLWHIRSQKYNNRRALLQLKRTTLGLIRSPSWGFPKLADLLVSTEKYLALETLSAKEKAVVEPLFRDTLISDHVLDAIGPLCSDSNGSLFGKTIDDLQPSIVASKTNSYMDGEIAALNLLVCIGWPAIDKNAYSGPFGKETKNPILFVGNTLDNATPLASARKSFEAFSNSKLLTISGTAHTSSGLYNECAQRIIQRHLTGLYSPTNETHCPTEGGPWGLMIESPDEDESWEEMKKDIGAMRHESIEGHRWKEIF